MTSLPRIIRQRCYQLHLHAESGRAALLTGTGELLFEFPLDVRIELADGGALSLPAPVSVELAGTRIVVRPVTPARGCARQELIFEPGEDSFTVAYRLVVADGASFRPGRIEYFRDAEVGMRLNTMRRGFHMHPWGLSEEDYFNLFPQPTLRGQTTPPALCIGMEFAAGWVGVGLMDFMDGTSFGVAHPRMGLLGRQGRSGAVARRRHVRGTAGGVLLPARWLGCCGAVSTIVGGRRTGGEAAGREAGLVEATGLLHVRRSNHGDAAGVVHVRVLGSSALHAGVG